MSNLNIKNKAELKKEKRLQKQYIKELNDFCKREKPNIKKRVKEVNEWYMTQETKDKYTKSIYRTKLNKAKIPEFDYSGEIHIDNASFTYGKKTPFEFNALKPINLKIKEGIVTAIIGTTGSGKSTLIQLTNGLIKSDTGRTKIGNYQIPASIKKIKEVKSLRKEVGLVFQFPEYQLFQETIEKDIAFGPINLGENKHIALQKVPELLELVGLPRDYAKRSPFDLSGGQKRRVAIAGIIAMDGNTLVLDEPTGGLDPKGESDFINLFKSMNIEKNKRIIIVTHNMDHVLQIADEVIVMKDGQVKAQDKPFVIFGNEELIFELELELPKLYQLAHKLKKRGIDLTNEEFRTIKEFVQILKTKLKR